jgi:drug/metabolite transporter (DMT)-like permease
LCLGFRAGPVIATHNQGPARELSIAIASLLGWLVLRESHPLRRLSGALLVVAGVAALTAS